MTAETSKVSQTGRNKSISRQLSLSSCAQQTPEPACRVMVGDVGDESLFFSLDSRADGVLTAVTTVTNAWDGIDPGGLGGCVCRRRRRRRLGLLARKRKGKGGPGRGRGRGGRVPNPDARRAGEPACWVDRWAGSWGHCGWVEGKKKRGLLGCFFSRTPGGAGGGGGEGGAATRRKGWETGFLGPGVVYV